jgi:type II secretory pathway pseudopilin PulG
VIYVIIGVLAGLLLVWMSGYFTGRSERDDRRQARADLQAALDRAAAAVPPLPSAGRFPVDTAPLLILSESAAAVAALDREVAAMVRDAERQIPERWR